MIQKRRDKTMRMFYGPYTILTGGLFLTLFPAFWLYSRVTGRYSAHLKERLGFIPPQVINRLSGSPRIWIHAVSLGEVKVAEAIIHALRRLMPACSLILSTFTEHGRKLATDTFGKEIPVIYSPIDFVGPVRKALSTVRPDAVVFLETEIWPAWLYEARRRGIKTAMINGRISVRTVGNYLRLRPFIRKVLENFDVFSMILEEDAGRIKAMGADPRKVEINGNAKYDLLGSKTDPAIETEMRQILGLDSSQPVLVAGSTREGEEELVLDAYEKILRDFPDTVLIIAPRHIERAPAIGALIERRGLRYQLRSNLDQRGGKRSEQIVIINTYGELFKVYSVGTIVFCGGSLVPLGGQNPLEPAAWAKVAFYGPSMEEFLDAAALLVQSGAGVQVSSPAVLAEKAAWFLRHPDELRQYGDRARDVALTKKGAAEKHALVIKRLLSPERPMSGHL